MATNLAKINPSYQSKTKQQLVKYYHISPYGVCSKYTKNGLPLITETAAIGGRRWAFS